MGCNDLCGGCTRFTGTVDLLDLCPQLVEEISKLFRDGVVAGHTGVKVAVIQRKSLRDNKKACIKMLFTARREIPFVRF